MDDTTFDRLTRIFCASQVVWARMEAVTPASPEWHRLRKKHTLLAERHRAVRAMAEPRTIN